MKKELIEIAYEINELNKSKLILSGSLALSLQDVNLRRKPSDIDFLLLFGETIILPKGMKRTSQYDVDDYDEGNERTYEIEAYRYKGVKIDVFIPNWEITYRNDQCFFNGKNHTMKILKREEIIKFKIAHSFGHAFSKFKHRDDIIHLLVNIK